MTHASISEIRPNNFALVETLALLLLAANALIIFTHTLSTPTTERAIEG